MFEKGECSETKMRANDQKLEIKYHKTLAHSEF